MQEVQKEKCKVLHLGNNNHKHQHILGAYQLESSFAKKNFGIPVDSKLTISQQCTLTAKKANSMKIIASRPRKVTLDPVPLLSAGEVVSGVLFLIQDSLVQERCRLTGVSPAQGHTDASHEERLLRLSSLEKRRPRGILPMCTNI